MSLPVKIICFVVAVLGISLTIHAIETAITGLRHAAQQPSAISPDLPEVSFHWPISAIKPTRSATTGDVPLCGEPEADYSHGCRVGQ